MLVNTTRSATIVFRFVNFNFGEVSTKASYAIRVRCPNRPVSAPVAESGGSTEWTSEHWLVPFGSSSPQFQSGQETASPLGSRPIPSEAVRRPLFRSQPGGRCHWAHPPLSKINLRHRSPPRAQTRKEIDMRGDISPLNAWNDSKTAVLRQLPSAAVVVRNSSLGLLDIWYNIPRKGSPYEKVHGHLLCTDRFCRVCQWHGDLSRCDGAKPRFVIDKRQPHDLSRRTGTFARDGPDQQRGNNLP